MTIVCLIRHHIVRVGIIQINKKMVKILIDSGSNLLHSEVKSLGIKELDYAITESYQKYTSKNTWNIYSNNQIFSEQHKLSYSRPMFTENWVSILKWFFDEGYDVLYLAVSQKISNSILLLNTAYNLFKEDYPDRKFVCIDTKMIGRSLGYTAKKLKKLADEGYPLENLIEIIQKFKNNTKTIWLPDIKEIPEDWNPEVYGALTYDENGNIIPYKEFSSLEESISNLQKEFKNYDSVEISYEGHWTPGGWKELKTKEALLEFDNAKYYPIHPFIFYSLGMNVQEYTFIKE